MSIKKLISLLNKALEIIKVRLKKLPAFLGIRVSICIRQPSPFGDGAERHYSAAMDLVAGLMAGAFQFMVALPRWRLPDNSKASRRRDRRESD